MHAYKQLLSVASMTLVLTICLGLPAQAEENPPTPPAPPTETTQPVPPAPPEKSDESHPPFPQPNMEPGKPGDMPRPEFQPGQPGQLGRPGQSGMFPNQEDRFRKGPQGEDMRGNEMRGDNENEGDGREQEREQQQEKQMVQNAQRQIKGLEQGLRQFERQVQMLTKQGVSAPADITETLAKLKSVIAAVKAAKTQEELTAAGWEDLSDIMDTLRDKQEMLQQLSRWPQTLKQVNRMLTNYTRQLAKTKTVVDRLRAKGIDMSTLYAELENNINTLKVTRDEAVANVKAGKAEDAYAILEDKFFGGDDDMMEKQRIIQTMSNVSRFPAEYKRGKKEMDRMVTKMKRKKVDMTEINPLYTAITTKGEEVLQLLKAAKPDAEAIIDALQELEDARQEFTQAAEAALGESEEMPWERKAPAGTQLSFAVPKFKKPTTMLALGQN